jgi:tetratricopeptide (TPR) repeat protein
LLSVLARFFKQGRWKLPIERGVEGQSLTAEDRLFILAQAALYLTATRGMGAPEARICYERLESLCHSINRPLLLYSALIGKWRYFLTTDKLTTATQIAKQVHSLALTQNDSALMTGAYNALACTAYYLGDFETARQDALRGAQMWRSGNQGSPVEEVDAPAVSCLLHAALSEWHLGNITSSRSNMAEAISLAKKLNDMPALTNALFNSGVLAHFERNVLETERLASDVIELSTRHNFRFWLAIGSILRGWARSASGDTGTGISYIEDGILDYRAPGQTLGMPYFLGLKAEALYFADRTSEALETIAEAEAFAQRSEARSWCAELYRLRSVFLEAVGA